jgi:hypothetical protein
MRRVTLGENGRTTVDLLLGKGETELERKRMLPLSCLTLIGCAKENISGIFLAALWKVDPAGSHG